MKMGVNGRALEVPGCVRICNEVQGQFVCLVMTPDYKVVAVALEREFMHASPL